MVFVRKLCKIWTFGDESSKPLFEQKPLFFRRFSQKTESAQSVRDLTFGTEGYRFESYRVYFLKLQKPRSETISVFWCAGSRFCDSSPAN